MSVLLGWVLDRFRLLEDGDKWRKTETERERGGDRERDEIKSER